jgi:O-acetylserine/cysteine efflux transporter
LRKLDILLGIIVGISWGASFTIIKLGTGHIPPIFLAAVKFAFMVAILLPFAKPQKLDLKIFSGLSLANALYHGFLFVSLNLRMDVTTNILIVQASVPLSALMSIMLIGEKAYPQTLMGIVISFIGMSIVVGLPSSTSSNSAIICAFMAAFFLACFNILCKKAGNYDPISMTAYSSIPTSIAMFMTSTVFEAPAVKNIVANLDLQISFIIAFVIITSVLALILWFHLLSTYPVNHVAPFSLLVPVFGALFSTIFFDVYISISMITGMAIALLGMAFIHAPSGIIRGFIKKLPGGEYKMT